MGGKELSKDTVDKKPLRVQLDIIRGMKGKIRHLNTTKKRIGTKYPIGVGYNTYVRRSFDDLLQWMNRVEDFLETILEEIEAE